MRDVPTTRAQYDALVSFSCNVGIANVQSSTLLKLHRAGDYPGAAAQFVRWNKAASTGLRLLIDLIREVKPLSM